MDDLRVAVIGIGNIGSAHAVCIAERQIKGMILSAVCDIDSEKIKEFKKRYPNVAEYCQYQDVLDCKMVDAVVIAVPHPLHADIAIAALSRGIHVMLEKPADITVTKVEELNRVAEKSGKKFGMMFNQRTNPLFKKAKELVDSGKLGEIKRTSWIITNWYRTQAYYD